MRKYITPTPTTTTKKEAPQPGGWRDPSQQQNLCEIHAYIRKSTKPLVDYQMDGFTSPFSPKQLYHFLKEGHRIESLKMRRGTKKDPVSVRTGQMVSWRKYHENLKTALRMGDEESYQRLKSYKLPAVVWSGVPNRQRKTQNWHHTGRINFDIDPVKGGPDFPLDARERLQSIPFLEAHGRSPRGVLPERGEGWANFLVEFPRLDQISTHDRSLFGETYLPRTEDPTTFQLHKLYADVIQLYLQYELDYPWGTHADPKRLRYLIYDPDLWKNPSPIPLTWATLKEMYSRLAPMRRQKKNRRHTRRLKEIDRSDLAQVLHAESCGHFEAKYKYEFPGFAEGVRHDFVLSWFITAHVLGIEADDAREIFEDMHHDGSQEVEEMVDGAISWVEEYYTKYEFGAFSSRLSQVGSAHIHLSKGEYLSDKLKPGDLDDKLLIAPTGSGKTRACMEKIEGPTIIATPLSALVRQIATRPGSEFCTVKPMVDDSGKEYTGINWKSPPEKIVCTIASMPVLIDELKKSKKIGDYHLVVDECHYFAMAATPNYMLSDLRLLWESRKMFRAQTLMTGTQLYLHEAEDLKLLRVTSDNQRRKTFRRVYVKRARQGRTTDTLAIHLRKLMNENPSTPIIVWQNDKKRLRPILQGLMADDDRILFVDSHTKTRDPNLWAHLCERPDFPAGVQCLVSTSTIQEGLDFEAYTGRAIVVFTGYPSVEEIQQLSERFRRAETIEIQLFATAPKEEGEQLIPTKHEPDPELMCALEANLAGTLHEIRRSRGLPASAYRALSLLGSRGYLYGRDGVGTGRDTLRLNHKAYKTIKRARWASPTLFNAALRKYGIEVLTDTYIEPVARTEEAQEAIDLANDTMKDEAQAAFQRTADNIFSIEANIVKAAKAYMRTANYMLAMGEEDAAFTIEEYMAYIRRDPEVYHQLLPEDQRLSKAHQQAVGARLYVEWLSQQAHCPGELTEAVNTLLSIPNGVYSEGEIRLMAADAVRALENVGASFPPFSIDRARKMLRPFAQTKKVRGRDEYELITFVLPEKIKYFSANQTTRS